MISFVWPAGAPLLAGTGGSETFTSGQARELIRRGIDTQIVTVGHGKRDGRQDFPDISFLALDSPDAISDLPGKVIFVNMPYDVKTKHKSAVILHTVIPGLDEQKRYINLVKDKTIITTSVYSAQQWALYLEIPYKRIKIVFPFADPVFGNIKRAAPSKKARIVFAGRLHPDKGIYTLLEAMHELVLLKNLLTVTIIAAGLHVETGKTIRRMLNHYPYARIKPAQKSVEAIAAILGASEVLIMPSVYAEPFGMLSIEAQQSGCRVVASNIGGLPETNCGLITLIEPHNPDALIHGIKQAIALGAPTKKERETAKAFFTLKSSVDQLLKALNI